METILVIEDNPGILENLVEFFEMEGYKVLVSNNGKEGIQLGREYIPDLIICDVLMQQVDGFQVLQSLLKIPETQSIPFIFSTSMSEKIDMTESLKLGADNYIIKPFELEELLKMVKSLLRSGSKRKVTPLVSPIPENNISNFLSGAGIK
jgi:DNA-binding response OmpR family regulator